MKLIKNFLNSEDKKRLFSNFISLSILEGVNYLLPLITFPYLVRVLGVEKFGLLAFANAFIAYFNIIVDYGFNLTATKEVSIHRDNKEKLSEIFSSVMIIKLILLVISFIILLLIVFNIEKFRKEYLVFIFSFGMVIGQTLFPLWFFQGIEKMRYITILNVLAKFIATISIFIFIKEMNDYIYVPVIYSAGFLVAGLASLWILNKNFKIAFKRVSPEIIKFYLKDSFHFFLSRVSVSLYTSSNTFILGLFTNETTVGFYSMAEKLYNTLRQLYNPVVQTLYPYVAYKKNVSLFRKIFIIVVTFNILLVLIVFTFAPEIICIIFGEKFQISAEVLRIFSIITFFVIPSILMGYPFLAALGLPEYANKSVIYGSILHIIGLFGLIFTNNINIFLIVTMVLITEIFVLFYRLHKILKYKLWRTS